MKIQFLGTGAADWNPAAANATQDYRRNASILVDDVLLVDPGPCIPEYLQTFQCPTLLDHLDVILNTHRHSDHFHSDTVQLLGTQLLHDMHPGETYETPRHKITAYAANHRTAPDVPISPVHFVIESKTDGKRFFYGCDGAWLFYETAMALCKQHFDLMIFDGTMGEEAGDYRIFEHNDLTMVRELSAFFFRQNCCRRFMVSHMARTLHPATHAEAAAVYAAYDIDMAYDSRIVLL